METVGGKIFQAIPAIMGEINAVGKNKKNLQQGFMYRGIDDVMNAINPALVHHKVFIVPEILEQSREERQTNKGANLIYSICKMRFRFCAEDGSSIEAVTIGEGMDSGDKATNKAMAIAFKYACFQVFCIPTEEISDPDAESHTGVQAKGKNPEQEKNPEQRELENSLIDEIKIATIRNTIMKKGVSEQSVLNNYQISNFKEMTFSMWNNAMQILEKYKDK